MPVPPSVPLGQQLSLQRCPHCNVDTPSLITQWKGTTQDCSARRVRCWRVYACQRCGGIVTAAADADGCLINDVFLVQQSIPADIPPKAAAFLEQAIASIHAPSGAIMLTASAVDAMLKNKGYKDGSLFARIDKAAADHMITQDVAKWAHEVRLDANDERHADESAPLPDEQDAQRSIDFASAFATLLFTLPARVTRGLTSTSTPKTAPAAAK